MTEQKEHKDNLDGPRLIERAFCLKQASLDSVYEKKVRHGHIATIHIWPARRPLAACRATLIATLLPDPGVPEKRRELLEKLGGKIIQVPKNKADDRERTITYEEETEGGILHWEREKSPNMQWFREEIMQVYGRPPRVLITFAGGGAIPLEAMRLGCETISADINPVAWFIEKCTLDYPQRLAGQKAPLPQFALESDEFMAEFSKAENRTQGKHCIKKTNQTVLNIPEADLAWHVRAWGLWIQKQAQNELEMYYPVIDKKITIAYLWARTVRCKNCRATIPLLKTRWLCKKDGKRILLTMNPNSDGTGVEFSIQADVPKEGGNAAQVKANDKRLGTGTMSHSGAWCPCCGKPGTVAMDMDDIKYEAKAGRLGSVITAVVVSGKEGKEYRLPTVDEDKCSESY